MKRLLLVLAGCATPAEPAAPDAATLQASLTTATHLAITGGTGAITAKRYAGDPVRVPLAIAGGAVAVDERAISGFHLAFAPIALDASAALAGVQLTLRAPAAAAIAWSDDDRATIHATLDVALAWSLAVDGSELPLNGYPLSLPVELALASDGEAIDARLSIVAPGALWSWASLLELDDLDLALRATNQPDAPEDGH